MWGDLEKLAGIRREYPDGGEIAELYRLIGRNPDGTQRCPHPRRGLVVFVCRNGAEQVRQRCADCGELFPRALKGFTREQKAAMPIERTTQKSPPCVRCGSVFTEMHHWAPRHLFEDADSWPVDYLCRECHRHWHATTGTTGVNKEMLTLVARLKDRIAALESDVEFWRAVVTDRSVAG